MLVARWGIIQASSYQMTVEELRGAKKKPPCKDTPSIQRINSTVCPAHDQKHPENVKLSVGQGRRGKEGYKIGIPTGYMQPGKKEPKTTIEWLEPLAATRQNACKQNPT